MQAPDKTRGNDKSATDSAQALRQRAEEIAATKTTLSPESLEALSPDKIRLTLHELQVHQIELEMQNEELRRAQLQLDTARARYFDLYDLAPVGYCTVGEPGLILEANFAAATLLGLSRGKLVGQRFSRFIAKSHQDSFYLYREQILASDEQQHCELQMVKSDGAPVWVALQSSAENDADGVCVLRIVLSDISERRQAQYALQQSEAFSRSIVKSSPDCIEVLDREGTLLSILAGQELLGVEDIRPFLNKSWLDFWKGKDRPAAQAALGSAATGLVGNFVGCFRTPHGEDKWWDVLISPILVADGKPARLLAVSRDVTLVQNNNIALAEATAAAEKANRAKSDFLSSMSHELRTPLNAILGFAQLMESGTPAPSPSQKRSVDQILQAGWYLLALINEILDLALIESGKLSLSRENISLTEVMRECKSMIEPQAGQRGIHLTFPAPELPYFVNADRTRMKQILVNLLSNAIKYNRAGGSVNVTCTEAPSGRIRICVEDTGEGLSQEKLRHLFEPFNRLGRDAFAEEGTGIGLVVAKRLVELMGGTIGVESTVGKGSTFWIEMGVTTEQQTSQATAPTQAAAQTRAMAPLRSLLYVEDNPANLMLVESLIERSLDLRLLSATDGNSGVEIARAALPDVILMDINLPDISGVEALKILRKDLATAHIPVVALSANAVPSDIDEGLAAGFFRYLTKPIRINALIATLDEALEFAKTQSVRAAIEERLQ